MSSSVRGSIQLFGGYLTHPGSISHCCRRSRDRTQDSTCNMKRDLWRQYGVGKDVVGSWIDLTKLVASDASEHRSAFPELAHDIGAEVYVDVNGWHLLLKDVSVSSEIKLHTALAQQIGPGLLTDGFNRNKIESVLKQVPVNLGGGKTKISLYDTLSNYSIEELMQICEKFAEDN